MIGTPVCFESTRPTTVALPASGLPTVAEAAVFVAGTDALVATIETAVPPGTWAGGVLDEQPASSAANNPRPAIERLGFIKILIKLCIANTAFGSSYLVRMRRGDDPMA